MVLISKVSKGSKMDQIYIPKNRIGFCIGDYVKIEPIIEYAVKIENPFFYGLNEIEPVKMEIIDKIFCVIEENIENNDNILITGSFLEKGFKFNDIDVIVLSNNDLNEKIIKNDVKKKIGVDIHLIMLNKESFIRGLEKDPIYRLMLSKCVSRKRFIYKLGREKDYKILDIHLLKSKTLIDNFDILTGGEKYDLVRNMISIFLFLEDRKLTKNLVDSEIKKIFDLGDITELKNNFVGKDFLKKYKKAYNEISSKILKEIKMVQNRNKLIKLFIGNISNAVVHEILSRSVSEQLVGDKYRKELVNSFEIAKKYREKINPVKGYFPVSDVKDIRNKILKNVKNELNIRINKGYTGINLDVIEKTVNTFLRKINILA